MTIQQLILGLIACIAAFVILRPLLFAGRRIAPAVAQQKLQAGEAVMIDVREPAERKNGVAAPAVLLPGSDLLGDRRQWKPFLAAHKDKELILYCASGIRSGNAALLLRKEGFRTANLGGLSRWRDIGLPMRKE
jgi:rhodanese-related sulfurtransferase